MSAPGNESREVSMQSGPDLPSAVVVEDFEPHQHNLLASNPSGHHAEHNTIQDSSRIQSHNTPSRNIHVAPTPESWREKSILTCDGGGIRGYASLLMIEQLMLCIGKIERSKESEVRTSIHTSSFGPYERPPGLVPRKSDLEGSLVYEYLPCHYFDYVMGTSTGGLIATMLSRWRMSVADCIHQYEIVGKDIFENKRTSVLGWPKTKHSKKPLIRAIKKLAASRMPKDIDPLGSCFVMFPAPQDLCKTAVVAIQKGRVISKTDGEVTKTQEGTYLFRSYKPDTLAAIRQRDPPLNYGVSINHEIWKVCRATTAAPLYFESQVIGDEEYCDGGAGVNNPTLEALNEMRRLHPKCVRTVVSFGTGKPERSSMFKDNQNRHIGSAVAHAHTLFQTAKASLTDCEKTHKEVLNRHLEAATPFDYFRFNVEKGLGKLKLNEWKQSRDNGEGGKCTTLEYIRKCAEKELSKEEVKKELLELATSLVRQRRTRAREDADQWERFACCTTYECRIEGCQDADTQEIVSFPLRRHMREHLRVVHNWDEEALETKLEECRTLPEFPAGPF